MRFLYLAPFAVTLAAFQACGGTTTQNGTAGATTSSSSGTSSGTTSTSSGMVGHGCTGPSDCDGGTCASLSTGAYKVCLSSPAQATMCQSMHPVDQCCTSADCADAGGGSCYPAQSLQFCGGAQIQSNICVKDGCQVDTDCSQSPTPSICAPAGAFDSPTRSCLAAYCRADGDCTAKPGGACLLIGNDPCCKYPSPDGLGCVYPGDCAKDGDCPMGDTCHIDMTTGTSACTSKMIGCPG